MMILRRFSRVQVYDRPPFAFYRSLTSGPEALSVATLAQNIRQAKTPEEAETLLENMKKEGKKLDVVVYNALAKKWAATNNIEKINAIISELEAPETNIQPNDATFSYLFHVYQNEGKIEEIENLIDKMTKLGIKPNHMMFHKLISAYINNNQPEKSFEVLDKMQEMGEKPSGHTLAAFVAGFTNKKNHKDLEKALEKTGEIGNKTYFGDTTFII